MSKRQTISTLRGIIFVLGLLLACAFGLLLSFCVPHSAIGQVQPLPTFVVTAKPAPTATPSDYLYAPAISLNHAAPQVSESGMATPAPGANTP